MAVLNAIDNNSGNLEGWFAEEEIFTTPLVMKLVNSKEERTCQRVSCSLLEQTTPEFLSPLLEKFQDLFSQPTCLPPQRDCDHRIRLLQGANPVAVRPNHYLHLLKDKMERQCAEMLRNGIIRPSNSPFSSPVLLVKKQILRGDFALILGISIKSR